MINNLAFRGGTKKMDMRDTIRETIVERGYKQGVIARRVQLTPAKLSATLNKKRKLEGNELINLCEVLEIDPRIFMQPQTAAR